MRYTTKYDANTTYTVALTAEELEVLRIYHMPKYHKAKEALEKFEDRYQDRIKTDHYYSKVEQLKTKYFYHKDSIEISNELRTIVC